MTDPDGPRLVRGVIDTGEPAPPVIGAGIYRCPHCSQLAVAPDEIVRLRAENDLALETIEALMRVIERDRPVIEAADAWLYTAGSGAVLTAAIIARRAASAPDEVNDGDPDGYRRARGVIDLGGEPAESVIRRARDGRAPDEVNDNDAVIYQSNDAVWTPDEVNEAPRRLAHYRYCDCDPTCPCPADEVDETENK